jgi:hypothetical protein
MSEILASRSESGHLVTLIRQRRGHVVTYAGIPYHVWSEQRALGLFAALCQDVTAPRAFLRGRSAEAGR